MFREDINGLRAWAVIAVLLFHFPLIGLPGGFSGVDVFFVISGYLMTSIIVGGYEKGKFSIWRFYMARARRILPALLVVAAALLALGWFWLPTADYLELANQVLAAQGFSSNIYFGLQGNYFSQAPFEKWLLHTWSLAVEAQFYLLFPIFVALVWKFFKGLKNITIGLSILFAASLILNLAITQWKPTVAFYLLPTRGWELAAGGLVYLINKQNFVSESTKKYGYWLGWVLVIASFGFLSEHLAWPGYWAIIPVVGASLIILSQKDDCKFTNNSIAQWLGDRSYSLYLWHWPLVVALYFSGMQHDFFWVAYALVLSILLALLSYRLVEEPTRKLLSDINLFKEILAITTAVIFIFLASAALKLFDFDDRMPSQVEVAANERLNFNPRRDSCQPDINGRNSPHCIYGDEVNIGAFLIGNSHADMVATAMGEAAKKYGSGVVFIGRMACPPIEGIKIDISSRQACLNFNAEMFDFLDSEPSGAPVVVSSSIPMNDNEDAGARVFFERQYQTQTKELQHEFSEKYIESMCKLASRREVFIVRPYPGTSVDIPSFLSRNYLLSGSETPDIKKPIDDHWRSTNFARELQDAAAEKCGLKILDPIPYLCDDQYCYGSKNGRPLYYDVGHLSEYGNKFLVPMFEEVFKGQVGQ